MICHACVLIVPLPPRFITEASRTMPVTPARKNHPFRHCTTDRQNHPEDLPIWCRERSRYPDPLPLHHKHNRRHYIHTSFTASFHGRRPYRSCLTREVSPVKELTAFIVTSFSSVCKLHGNAPGRTGSDLRPCIRECRNRISGPGPANGGYSPAA